jgi:glycerol-3-phosphate acyltransferase PlsY
MKTGLEIVLIIVSYLLGSIPFGYIFTKRLVGINIREHGSGNTGSTNVRRIAGRKVALYTQLCDMMKGLIPVAIILLLQYYKTFDFDNFFIYAVALSAILGHDFSIFLKFKGGKGVNTTLGASLLLSPYSVFASVLVYFLVKWSTKYVSLGSVCLAITLTLTDVIIHKTSIMFYYFLICSALIIIRHIPNIKRLLNGTESRSK